MKIDKVDVPNNNLYEENFEDSNKCIKKGKLINISEVSDEKLLTIKDLFDFNKPTSIELDLIVELSILELLTNIEDEDEDEAHIDAFLEYFKADLLMDILYDTVKNILLIFNSKKKIKQHQEIFNELFFKDKEEFKYYLKGFDKVKSLDDDKKDTWDLLFNIFYNKIPKILFPWYLYAIKIDVNELKNGKKITQPIRVKKLHLFEIKNDSTDFVLKAIQEIRDFMIILSNDFNDEFNKSLNLYAFNHVTNLLDIYILVNSFLLDYKGNEILEFDKFSEGAFYYETNAGIINLPGLKAKDYALIHSIYNEKYFGVNKEIAWYSRLKDVTKKNILKTVNIDFDQDQEIEKEYLVYSKLKSFEPYDNVLPNSELFKLFNQDEVTEQIILAYQAVYSEKKRKKDLLKNSEQMEQVERKVEKKGKGKREQPKRKTILDLIEHRKK